MKKCTKFKKALNIPFCSNLGKWQTTKTTFSPFGFNSTKSKGPFRKRKREDRMMMKTQTNITFNVTIGFLYFIFDIHFDSLEHENKV